MIIRLIGILVFGLMGGCIAAVANFFLWYFLAGMNPDPTVGGAYCAMMMLTAIPVSIFGAIMSASLFNHCYPH